MDPVADWFWSTDLMFDTPDLELPDHVINVYFSSSAVLGQNQTVSDALQAPTRLLLPPSCSAEEGAPLHAGPDHVSGCSLGLEVHLPGHHLPCNGV